MADGALIKVSSAPDEYASAKNLTDHLLSNGLTISCAESATCGMVAKLLTDRAGSSAWFWGGVESYANNAKTKLLGVPRDLLDDPKEGPVSHRCACLMAEGIRSLSGTDLAVSVTGIAGPGGEEPGKPVGTVYFGFSSKDRPTQAVGLCFGPSDRDQLRRWFASAVLVLCLRFAKGESIVDIDSLCL